MDLRPILAALLLTGGLALPASCGGGASAFCDAKCDCRFCSDYDYDRCLAEYDGDEARADRMGCLHFFDAYADCVDSWGCRGGDFDDVCKPEKERWKSCVK